MGASRLKFGITRARSTLTSGVKLHMYCVPPERRFSSESHGVAPRLTSKTTTLALSRPLHLFIPEFLSIKIILKRRTHQTYLSSIVYEWQLSRGLTHVLYPRVLWNNQNTVWHPPCQNMYAFLRFVESLRMTTFVMLPHIQYTEGHPRHKLQVAK